MAERQDKVFYLRPCSKHGVNANLVVQTGPDESEEHLDRIMDGLLCRACWRRNPKQMADLCDVLKIAGTDLDQLLAARR